MSAVVQYLLGKVGGDDGLIDHGMIVVGGTGIGVGVKGDKLEVRVGRGAKRVQQVGIDGENRARKQWYRGGAVVQQTLAAPRDDGAHA